MVSNQGPCWHIHVLCNPLSYLKELANENRKRFFFPCTLPFWKSHIESLARELRLTPQRIDQLSLLDRIYEGKKYLVLSSIWECIILCCPQFLLWMRKIRPTLIMDHKFLLLEFRLQFDESDYGSFPLWVFCNHSSFCFSLFLLMEYKLRS